MYSIEIDFQMTNWGNMMMMMMINQNVINRYFQAWGIFGTETGMDMVEKKQSREKEIDWITV